MTKMRTEGDITTENPIPANKCLDKDLPTSPGESNSNQACRHGGSFHPIEINTMDAAIYELRLGCPVIRLNDNEVC
jgi:hypothetical protein